MVFVVRCQLSAVSGALAGPRRVCSAWDSLYPGPWRVWPFSDIEMDYPEGCSGSHGASCPKPGAMWSSTRATGATSEGAAGGLPESDECVPRGGRRGIRASSRRKGSDWYRWRKARGWNRMTRSNTSHRRMIRWRSEHHRSRRPRALRPRRVRLRRVRRRHRRRERRPGWHLRRLKTRRPGRPSSVCVLK